MSNRDRIAAILAQAELPMDKYGIDVERPPPGWPGSGVMPYQMTPEQRVASGMLPYTGNMDPVSSGLTREPLPSMRYNTGERPPVEMRDHVVSNKDVQNALMMGGQGLPEDYAWMLRRGPPPYAGDPKLFPNSETRPLPRDELDRNAYSPDDLMTNYFAGPAGEDI